MTHASRRRDGADRAGWQPFGHSLRLTPLLVSGSDDLAHLREALHLRVDVSPADPGSGLVARPQRE